MTFEETENELKEVQQNISFCLKVLKQQNDTSDYIKDYISQLHQRAKNLKYLVESEHVKQTKKFETLKKKKFEDDF